MTASTNINSIRNKFERLTSLITNERDVLLLSETKIDETVPVEQFLISGFAKLLRLDRNSRGGGIKNFENNRFSEELLSEIKKLGPLNKNISIFRTACIEVLEKYAPEKQKYIRANQTNYMDSKSCCVYSYVTNF